MLLSTLLLQAPIATPMVIEVHVDRSSGLSALPIVLSGIAIVVSLLSLVFNSYYQYFKGPRLRLLVADQMDVWLSSKKELVFNTVVTIFNDGARYGAVSRIMGEVSTPVGKRIPFRWRMFFEQKNVAEEGVRFKPHASFAGWAYTLVIPAREAIAQNVQFVTSQELDLHPGSYTFEFKSFLGDLPDPRARSSIVIELNQAVINLLGNTTEDPDARISRSSVRLTRRLGNH